ncbi:DUF397 domain-containing protein [Nocardiopsis sp. NPDC006938]|uniref:DUF397 domain-containing protein n=1 Tax=Nocardiopsis sp. NPDC006938 TaxID=3364337 RepID=UPI003682953C
MDLNNASWRKSSYSAASSNNCVEVADLSEATAVRDTQHRELGHLLFGHDQWVAMTTTIRTQA